MARPSRQPHALLLIGLSVYTVYSAGPFAWIAAMSLRTTSEISAAPYGLPDILHRGKYWVAWSQSNYDVYYQNSTLVTVAAVALLTIIGAMAAHCLAR